MDITDLPDYQALKNLRDMIWKNQAAVMVGSGFSKYAIVTPGANAPPLWWELKNQMIGELYPEKNPKEVTSDPMEIAQEYEDFFGKAHLRDMLLKFIDYKKWKPGKLHEKLLDFPWKDVLTTNWDTLLEETELDSEKSFNLVSTVSQIAHYSSPRIIKLHGSLPDVAPLIFTKEHFRTYAQEFAPFVNLTQQIILENELCLIGFSGDDPNFLAWSGWVRDNLGDNARKIKMIVADGCSPSKRKMLERRNIIVIDLEPLVKDIKGTDDRFEIAHEKFMKFIEVGEPEKKQDWSTLMNSDVEVNLKLWKKIRSSYPGWVWLPAKFKYKINAHANNFYEAFRDPKALKALENPENPQDPKIGEYFPYLLWFHEISATPPLIILAEYLKENAEDIFSLANEREEAEMLSYLAADARRTDDGFYEVWMSNLQKVNHKSIANLVNYEKALVAKEELNFSIVEDQIKGIEENSPLWCLRKAYLLIEINEFDKARALYKKAFEWVKKDRRLNPQSIELISLEAWTRYLHKWTEFDFDHKSDPWKNRPTALYREMTTDPLEIFSSFEQEITKEIEEKNEKREKLARQPLFDSGSYRTTISLDSLNRDTGTMLRLKTLVETIGVPNRIKTVVMLEGHFEKALRNSSGTASKTRHVLNISNAEGKNINKLFNRHKISCLKEDEALDFYDKLKRSVVYFLSQLRSETTHWKNPRLKILFEILSRFAFRLPSNRAEQELTWVLSLGPEQKTMAFFVKQYSNLVTRLFETIDPSARGKFLRRCVVFPISLKGHWYKSWPDLVTEFTEKDWDGLAINAEIKSYIEKLIVEAPEPSSLNRLKALFKSRKLNEKQESRLADAIWGNVEDNSWPAGFQWLFLELPIPDEIDVTELFINTTVKDFLSDVNSDSMFLHSLYNCLPLEVLDRSRIVEYFLPIAEKCLSWVPPTEVDLSTKEGQNIVSFKATLGVLLAFRILPEMPEIHEDSIREIVKVWRGKLSETESLFNATLYHFGFFDPEFAWKRIFLSVLSTDRIVAQGAFQAMHQFVVEEKKWDRYEDFYDKLVELISMVAIWRQGSCIPNVFQILTTIVENKRHDFDPELICTAVENALVATSYDKKFTIQEHIDATSIRVECATILNLIGEDNLRESFIARFSELKKDPQPEVRREACKIR